MLGGSGSVDHQDILELIATGGQDAGPLVDLGGVEQVEDRKVLYIQDIVHALQAQSAFAIQEVGDVVLLKTGLCGQMEAGQITLFDTRPQSFAQIFLQRPEFHGRSIAPVYSGSLYEA